ncbi:MAG: signal peptide peptidase SppA [Bacteroidetes bacterium]|nr:signal peptide peptidase SppA [Bacteroidota bacterium]
MKSFFKNVLANIVAIFLIFATVFFFFIFIMMLGSMSDNKPTVKKNSVLTLDFKTQIIDSETEDEENVFDFKNKKKNIMLYKIVEAIKEAKTDDNIKGISIETDFIQAGITQLDDIRTALEDFKKSGKFVYAYGNTVSQPAYYLGSVADQYFLNPSGGIELKGLSTEVVFLKDFTKKYGIGMEVIRHGKFKAAVEPFLRNDISPENKEQLSTLLNDIWDNTSMNIAKSRKISNESFKTAVDSLYGFIPELSLKNKLVDRLLQKSEYDNIIKKKIGVNSDDDLNSISFNKYINSKEKNNSGDEIAILYASGTINNGEGNNNIYAVDYVKQIQELQKDKNVKAVVLRINSPGGSANASDEILFELQQLKKSKPLIVSFGDYAASGGYYIAMAADKIYSEPNTLTGSIGVFGTIPNAKVLANKNGIRADAVNTNANSNMISVLNGMTPYGINIMTKSVEGTYKRFVHFVTENRKKSFDQIDAIGGGRVWSGKRAKEIGLVDELGNLQDAITFAANKSGTKKYSVEAYPKKKDKFEELMEIFSPDDVEAKWMKSRIGEDNYKIYKSLLSEENKSQILMESPYKVTLQ